MKFLILGRTAVGKDMLKNLLSDDFGWRFVTSYTTRPRRLPGENTHFFITPEEAAEVPDSEKAAKTVIAGYEYYATKEQIENCDAYIIDPDGMRMLLTNMPDERFYVIYIRPSSKETQKEMALKREDDPQAALDAFEKRTESEDRQFSAFETQIGRQEFEAPNVISVIDFTNDYGESCIRGLAAHLESLRRFRRNAGAVIQDLMNADIMNHDDDGNPILILSDKSQIVSTADELSDFLFENPEMLGDMIKRWFCLHTTDLPSYITARDIDPDVFLENIGPAVENMMGSEEDLDEPCKNSGN